MKYAGIQPYAYYQGDLYLLLGQEQDSQLWSNFAGGIEDEDQFLEDTAIREGYEETMGMLGTPEDLAILVASSLQITFSDGVIYAFEIPFNLSIIYYFQLCYQYVKTAGVCNQDGFFEKQAMRWVRASEIMLHPEWYRSCFLKTLPGVLQTIVNYD